MHFMMQLNRTDQSSPGLLLSGLMLVSIGLLWSGTGTINNHKQFEVVYSPFLNPIEGFCFGLKMAWIQPKPKIHNCTVNKEKFDNCEQVGLCMILQDAW